MSFLFSQNSIEYAGGDAIVIPAHTDLRQCSGLSEAVFKKAGPRRLSLACKRAKALNLGDAFVTSGFKSKYNYIVHVACLPDGQTIPDNLLFNSYISALTAAKQKGAKTVSVPILKYSNNQKMPDLYKVAYAAITEFIKENDIEVTLYVDRYSDLFRGQEYDELRAYIQEHWKEPPRPANSGIKFSKAKRTDYFPGTEQKPEGFPNVNPQSIEEINKRLGIEKEYFADYLIKLIDGRDLSNVEVYTKANISRQQFSRIISNKDYNPQKKTVYAFAIALRLSRGETEKLLRKAGHAISETDRMDIIMMYFLEKRKYDIFEINDALLYYGEPLLGSGM